VGQEGLKEGDYQTPIHQSMTITGLSSEIFGDDYAYVALGHIHRPHRVSEGVYYSGTPVATNVTEVFEPRKVMLVDETGHVEALPVPIWRESFVLRDDAHTLHDLLCELRWSSELPPYVYLEVDGDGGGPEEFQKLLAREFPKSTPRIASFKRASINPSNDEAPTQARDLHTYTPEEVFELFWTRRFGEDVGPSERAAFHELLAEVLGDEG
jgi:exonuclease SbcD